jgi:hypothetical protein
MLQGYGMDNLPLDFKEILQMASPKTLPRGIRLNNPGNIVKTPTKWLGQSEDQSKDTRFVSFTEPRWGIRALAKTLMTYQDKYKLNTCAKIINRWAPPHENDTKSYVATLCKTLGVKPNDVIDVQDYDTAFKLVVAITTHENGMQPFSDGQISAGLRLAGIIEKEAKLTKSRTIKGSMVAGTGGAVALVTAGLEQAAEVLPSLSYLTYLKDLSPIILGVLGVLALMGAAYAIYARIDDRKNGIN